MKKTNKIKNQNGFTIMELMIATAVFTTILLVATFALIQIGKIYSKGVNTSATQRTARSITDEVSQAIQFSGSNVSSPTYDAATKRYFFAAGNKCYSFYLGKQLDSSPSATDQSKNVFVRKDISSCALPQATNWSGNDFTELMGQHMRVASFYICSPGQSPCSINTPSAKKTPADSNLYSVGIKVVYGDKDLLCRTDISSGAGSCTSNSTIADTDIPSEYLICKAGAGSQFCASSQIDTTVQKRL